MSIKIVLPRRHCCHYIEHRVAICVGDARPGVGFRDKQEAQGEYLKQNTRQAMGPTLGNNRTLPSGPYVSRQHRSYGGVQDVAGSLSYDGGDGSTQNRVLSLIYAHEGHDPALLRRCRDLRVPITSSETLSGQDGIMTPASPG